ncbi:hypothetical protein [Nostoc sp. CMAA1605]|nr:hypothetical protein [Nostoc sp. CMAA1605]
MRLDFCNNQSGIGDTSTSSVHRWGLGIWIVTQHSQLIPIH